MKKKANDLYIDSGLLSKKSKNTIIANTTPSNSNLIITKTSNITKTIISKPSKSKESFINPIANNNMKIIIDDEIKKQKTLNNLNMKNLEIKVEILNMLIKKIFKC